MKSEITIKRKIKVYVRLHRAYQQDIPCASVGLQS